MKSPFRSIRQTLFNEGKLLRYLGYAVGEIALIIIGILFALKINNMNEDRKAQVEFDAYIVQLREDVKEAIEYVQDLSQRTERAGIQNYKVVEFLEGVDIQTGNLASFETALKNLGRYYEPQLEIGLLSDLLQGNMDVIRRDKAFYRRTKGMLNRFNRHLSTIAHVQDSLDQRRVSLDEYKAANISTIPTMPFRYDLEELKNSNKFIRTTQNISAQMISVSLMLGFIEETLQNYLLYLEEY